MSRFVSLLLVGAFLLFSLEACSATPNRYDGLKVIPFKPVLHQPNQVKKNHPKIGIAFGGGGIRGFMHLGVIKALEEANIRADVVTGSSAGSIAAALYASGMPYSEIEKIVSAIKQSDFVDLGIGSGGFIRGQKLAGWIRNSVGKKRIEAMPIPLGITVTDLESGKPYLVVAGDVGEAVQASSSIPGAFVPIHSKGKTFVDGGILTLIPVRFAQQMGADIVIGVDIYCGKLPPLEKSAFSTAYIAMMLQTCALSKDDLAAADLVIQPQYEPENAGSFKTRDRAISEGYKATKERLPKLLQILGRN